MIRLASALTVALCALLPSQAMALQSQEAPQQPEKQESTMTDRLPKIGSPVPEMQIYDADGKPFETGQFKDHYTVLVFGCLT